MPFNRLFISCFSFVAVLAFAAEKPAYSQFQTGLPYGPVEREIRENGKKHTVQVPGNHRIHFQGTDCGNPAHATSNSGAFFEHIHVDASFDVTGEDEEGVIRTVTVANVKAYWDDWFAVNHGRENVESWGSDDGEDLTYNCWGYSFGYTDIWINNPSPFYDENEGDYEPTGSPSVGDVIELGWHVITVTSINHCESPYLAIGTSEKMRHSGIYHFLYEYSNGIGDDSYKNFFRGKYQSR